MLIICFHGYELRVVSIGNWSTESPKMELWWVREWLGGEILALPKYLSSVDGRRPILPSNLIDPPRAEVPDCWKAFIPVFTRVNWGWMDKVNGIPSWILYSHFKPWWSPFCLCIICIYPHAVSTKKTRMNSSEELTYPEATRDLKFESKTPLNFCSCSVHNLRMQ